jgi:hypothetical protein
MGLDTPSLVVIGYVMLALSITGIVASLWLPARDRKLYWGFGESEPFEPTPPPPVHPDEIAWALVKHPTVEIDIPLSMIERGVSDD